MMTFYDIKDYLNENSIITIWDADQNLYCAYDGKESIPEFLDEYPINDIFTDIYMGKNSIGIELEFYTIEIIED